MSVRSLFKFVSRPQPRACAVPDGRRIYAIGDIHGRLDLLDRAARHDRRGRSRARAGAATELIFLGDLVDRGPDSRGRGRAADGAAAGPRPVRFLMGNHEEVFLRALAGDPKALRFLIRIGGRETLLSYGITEERISRPRL